MNGRTARLLRSYSISTNKSLKEVKREWLSTPRPQRCAVRREIQAGLWMDQLKRWRLENELLQKQACDALGVPIDTLKSWECGRNTPHRIVMSALRRVMSDYQSKAIPS